MNGVFDLGGTDGMGHVAADFGEEPVFHADWEKAALAMFPQCARAGLCNIDEFRHAIERIDPAEYLLSNYYEHWTHAFEEFALKKGLFTAEQLDERIAHFRENPTAPLPDTRDPELLDFINAATSHGFQSRRETDKKASFCVGDRVLTTSDSPTGHTRRARYIRGKRGVVTSAHGAWVYPDSSGNGHGDAPEHLYTVVFTASELWGGETADPNSVVYFDIFEPYIIPISD
ncbi:nitrile hydratase subunit beta [Rhodococcus koreensis]